MASHTRAFAFRSGVIDFGDVVPDGAIVIAKGYPRRLRLIVEKNARLAYDGVTLLVPGVPEESNDDLALDALIAFSERVEDRL